MGFVRCVAAPAGLGLLSRFEPWVLGVGVEPWGLGVGVESWVLGVGVLGLIPNP